METNINHENLSLEEMAEIVDGVCKKIKDSIYAKKHYENNKEEYKKRNRKFRENNPLYYKNYRKEHPEKIEKARKKQIEKNSGDFIYFFFDWKMRVIYCGSTTNLKARIQQHFTGNTSIGVTFDNLCDGHNEYDYMITCYKDFTKYDLTRLELYYIEKFLKDNCFNEKIESPVYRSFDDISEDRKRFLEDIAINEHFLDFDDSRYWDM